MGFKAWYPAKNSRIASKDISGLPDDLRVVLLRHEAHSCSWKSFSCSQVGTPLASGYSTRCAKVDKGAMFMLGFGVDVVREALSCLYCGKVADQVVFLLILCINPVRKPIEKPERSATTFQTAISEKMLPLRRKWRRLCKSWVLILRTRQIGEWKWGGFSMKCIFQAFKWLQTVWRLLRESKTVWEPPPKVQLALFQYLILLTPLAQKRTHPINTYM